MAGTASNSVRNQIEGLRKKLLDLTLRNRMLNYRPSKRLGIEVVGENSFEVHRMLVEEGKKMTFEGKLDPPRTKDIDWAIRGLDDDVIMAQYRQAAEEEMDAFLGNAAMPKDQMDTKLSTEEFESMLQAKLKTIFREAGLADEELGINTLFLTLGRLEWSETEDRTFRAPLLFVPVALERQGNGTIKLRHDGSDVGENLPLRAKLAEFNLKLPVFDDEKTLLDYFSEVESTILRRESWQVHRDEICLGFFNYEKYAMYVDLGGENWPEDRKPWMNPDAIAMLGAGYAAPENAIEEFGLIDDHRPVAESREIFDADSSQTIAMIRAKANLSIVVEGPPGTGKSQTIANIIAEAAADGKTVLFVSAKRAALEVVRRRLDEAELGAICLDLHDKMTNRKEFYAELKRTVNRSLNIREEEAKVTRLAELRDKLNHHSAAMNEVLPKYGLTPFEAMARLAQIPKESAEDRAGRIAFESLAGFVHSDILVRLPLVTALQSRLKTTGVPVEHPYWGAQIDYLDPSVRLDLEEELASAIGHVKSAREAFARVCKTLKVQIPGTALGIQTLRRCAETAIASPSREGVSLKAEDWRTQEAAIRQILEALRTRNHLRQRRGAQVSPTIWTLPIPVLAQTYIHHAPRWAKFLSGEYRQAKRTLAAYLTPTASTSPLEIRDLLVDLRTVQESEALIEEAKGLMERLYGVQWQGLQSNPDSLEQILDWVLNLRQAIGTGKLPPGLLDFLSGTFIPEGLTEQVDEAAAKAEGAMQAYGQAADLLKFDRSASESETWEALAERLEKWRSSLPRLAEHLALNELRKQIKEAKLESVVQLADQWPLAAQSLSDAFLRSYYSGVVREAMQERPSLKAFEREGHEAMIAEFRNLDDFKLHYNRAQVRLAHHRRLPTFVSAVGNLQLLKMQCELQRRHKPIRWIMARAGEAIQRIKPVFMMSPLSVAIHLPPELPPFDMVIFDEASQVRPEDAFCAIVRAKQTIVVGDTRQMPPTSFFDRVTDDEDELEEDADEWAELGQEARKVESVLSLMSAVTLDRARRPDLRWHYRSIHPALIQPSNEMFYDNRLVVFPSPGLEQAGRRIGVVFHHHPETVYEPGSRKRFNQMEAELVAKAVLRHLRESPQESLMVAAMNKSQADLIHLEVAKLERQEPEPFEAFRQHHPHEKLDIKNLENVQGDERDVVFISVTYGRDANGVIRQQFGPLLRDGGERRLNVLVTRARRRCEVFSNLTADDLRVEANYGGVACLKRYLQFAQTGRLDVDAQTGGAEESPFEEEMKEALQGEGYEVHTQIGSAGYRIDLAVIDPKKPGRYLVGIECDGTTYHSAQSARDRDKLRQRVLENRGWFLHRIWSHDWWQDRDGEVRRLLNAIAAAQTGQPPAPPVMAPLHEVMVEETPEAIPKMPVEPYRVTPPRPIQDEADLQRFLCENVQCEGPMHFELLMMRLRDSAGYKRADRYARARLDQLINDTVGQGFVKLQDDYLYTDESQLVVVRDWSRLTWKKVDYVTSAELRAALMRVVETSFGTDGESAVKAAFSLLGFKRVSESSLQRGWGQVEALIQAGKLAQRDGTLNVVSG